MNKEELISRFCKYYKGEKENPHTDPNSRMFWDLEKSWFEESNKPDFGGLADLPTEYIKAGLIHFHETDNTPYLLKVLLFNRYRHWLGGNGLYNDATAFKDWYEKIYIGQAQ